MPFSKRQETRPQEQFDRGATVPVPGRKERPKTLWKVNTDELCDSGNNHFTRLRAANNHLEIGCAVQEIDQTVKEDLGSEMSAIVAATFEKPVVKYFKADFYPGINGAVAEKNEMVTKRVAKIYQEGALVESCKDAVVFITPTGVDVKKTDLFMKGEIFGPVLPVLTVRDLSEAIEYINQGEKPVAAYIFTSNERKEKRLVTETSSGGVTINDVVMHITVDTLPFGGVGNSGMGRYRGKYGFDTFTHEKAVLKRGFVGESLQASRYPLMTQKKLENLQMLTGRRINYPRIMNFFGHLPKLLHGKDLLMKTLDILTGRHFAMSGGATTRSTRSSVRLSTTAPAGPPAKIPANQSSERDGSGGDGGSGAGGEQPVAPCPESATRPKRLVVEIVPRRADSALFGQFHTTISVQDGDQFELSVWNLTDEDFDLAWSGWDGAMLWIERETIHPDSHNFHMMLEGNGRVLKVVEIDIEPGAYHISFNNL